MGEARAARRRRDAGGAADRLHGGPRSGVHAGAARSRAAVAAAARRVAKPGIRRRRGAARSAGSTARPVRAPAARLAPWRRRPRPSRRSGGSRPARLIAGLARCTGDVGLAEELAQDALVAALEQWPREGVPAQPGAWLTAVAKRRAHRRLPARRDAASARRRARPRAGGDGGSRRPTWTPDAARRRRHRRRPAAAGLHRLPPGAVRRGPGRADAAAARRPDHGRDRARVPGRRSRRSRSASCGPRDAGRRAACRSRCRAARSGAGGWPRCWR